MIVSPPRLNPRSHNLSFEIPPTNPRSCPRNGRDQRRLLRHRRNPRHRRQRHREPNRPGARLLHRRHARAARVEEQAGHRHEARYVEWVCGRPEPDVLYARHQDAVWGCEG